MAATEFGLAEGLREKAGISHLEPPTPLEAVVEYLARYGLELCYYSPQQAPAAIQSTATEIDEALIFNGQHAFLFINQERPQTRLRFSVFHGIGHFCLPSHHKLNYLERGCVMQPSITRAYERQAHRFAAAMNMPPQQFRQEMSHRPFGMGTVEQLAQRYIASLESAAIHYVTLADIPCAAVWLQPDYDDEGFCPQSSPLRVRYQIRSHSFPFSIRPGTRIPLNDNPFWLCSEEESLAQGSIAGENLGLDPGVRLWVDCVPQGHMGAVLALVSQGSTLPDYAVCDDWVQEL